VSQATNENIELFGGPVVEFMIEQEKALKVRRFAVVAAGNPDSVAELDGTIAAIRSAYLRILAAQHERQEARERHGKWLEIVPRCREAQDKFAQIGIDFEKANEKYFELESRAENARAKLLQARERRPKAESFPTPKELQKQAELEQKLEGAVSEIVAKVRAANERRHELQRQQWQCQQDLNTLLFQERNLRGRQETEPQPLLSAVG
jgi:hypothetical protein